MISRLRAALRRRKGAWESLCRQCGVCCYEKKIIKGRTVIDFSLPCQHLRSDNSCAVYADRFSRCRECSPMSLWHALFTAYLPENCGYVEAYRPRWLRRAGTRNKSI